MKNYTQPAKQILETKIQELVFEVAPDLKVHHRKVNFTKAECEINVRKGKQILVYDFELDLTVFGITYTIQAKTNPRMTQKEPTKSGKSSVTTSTI
jgi:activator of HSP90 ATPase